MADGSKTKTAGLWLQSILNWLLALAGLACLLRGVHLLWTSADLAAAGVGLTAGLVLILAASIERFEVLKGLGVEARTHKLDDAIKEANATVEQLRELGTAVSEVALTEMMASNFFFGSNMQSKVALHDKLIAALANLDVSPSQMLEADTSWRGGVGILYHRIVRKCLESASREASKNNSEHPAMLAPEEFDRLGRFDEWRAPSPDEMENFVIRRNLMTTEIKEWINDYRHYVAKNEIRRLQEFAKH